MGERLGSDGQGGGRGQLQGRDTRSDFYIVKTPDGGIPAADLNATPPEVGSAKCTVYQINSQRKLIETKRQEIVWNLESSVISGDQFIKIAKDKFGRWHPMQGGGGGGNYWATITRVIDDCNCLVAKAVVYRIPCSGASAEIGEEITVYDDLGCDLPTHAKEEWIGVKIIVCESKGELDPYYDSSPLPAYCDPDEDGYLTDVWEDCHFSIVRVCCP